MRTEDLERKVNWLEERIRILEDQQRVGIPGTTPTPFVGYVPVPKDTVEPPPFHDPVLE